MRTMIAPTALIFFLVSCGSVNEAEAVFAQGQYVQELQNPEAGETLETLILSATMEARPLRDNPGAYLLVADAGLFSGCRAIFVPDPETTNLEIVEELACGRHLEVVGNPSANEAEILSFSAGTLYVDDSVVAAEMSGNLVKDANTVDSVETSVSISLNGNQFN